MFGNLMIGLAERCVDGWMGARVFLWGNLTGGLEEKLRRCMSKKGWLSWCVDTFCYFWNVCNLPIFLKSTVLGTGPLGLPQSILDGGEDLISVSESGACR